MKELNDILSKIKRKNISVTEMYSMSNFTQQYGSKTDPKNTSPYANDVPNQETTSDTPNSASFFLPGKSGGDNSKPKKEEEKKDPLVQAITSQKLREQEKDENRLDPNEAASDVPAEEPQVGDTGGDPNAAQQDPNTPQGNPNAVDPNMDPNAAMTDPSMMGGMGGNVDPQTGMPVEDPSHLGRVYEIKKIYTRLTSIESYLSSESDPFLVKIRSYVSQAIQLFEILAANLQSYKEKLDEIIVQYYKFLDLVFALVKERYKEMKDKDK
jgi:hypothetical protein